MTNLSALLKHHQQMITEKEAYQQSLHAELQSQLEQAHQELRRSESTHAAELSSVCQQHDQQVAELQMTHASMVQVSLPGPVSRHTMALSDLSHCCLKCLQLSMKHGTH